MTTAITKTDPATLTLPTVAEAMQLASMFAQSGYFSDAKTAAQCIVKIEYGRELGIGPAAAMMGVHIIEGKPAPSANLMATLIKRSRRYDFRVRPDWNATHCTIDFYERRELIGTITFTIEQARNIKDRNGGILANKLNWQNYPQAMLWARAISAGARAFCADIFGGAPVYTAEELGADEPPVSTGDTETITVESHEVSDEQPASDRPQDSASAPVESRAGAGAGAQGRTAPPTNGAASPARAAEASTHESPAVQTSSDLESAWKEYRYLAPQAGYTTAEAQKAHIQEFFPGERPRDLTLAKVQMLIAVCKSILDLPANDGAEQVA